MEVDYMKFEEFRGRILDEITERNERVIKEKMKELLRADFSSLNI